jgi:hypothetical protein
MGSRKPGAPKPWTHTRIRSRPRPGFTRPWAPSYGVGDSYQSLYIPPTSRMASQNQVAFEVLPVLQSNPLNSWNPFSSAATGPPPFMPLGNLSSAPSHWLTESASTPSNVTSSGAPLRRPRTRSRTNAVPAVPSIRSTAAAPTTDYASQNAGSMPQSGAPQGASGVPIVAPRRRRSRLVPPANTSASFPTMNVNISQRPRSLYYPSPTSQASAHAEPASDRTSVAIPGSYPTSRYPVRQANSQSSLSSTASNYVPYAYGGQWW